MAYTDNPPDIPEQPRSCACGQPARPRQRNCKECHAAAQARYRERQGWYVEEMKTKIQAQAERHPETTPAEPSDLLAFAIAVRRIAFCLGCVIVVPAALVLIVALIDLSMQWAVSIGQSWGALQWWQGR